MNIFIWTSRKSVGHETNDRVMVHGEGTRADGRRFGSGAQMNQIVGSRDRRGARSISGSRSNVMHNQADWLAHPTTEAPETQIYFITHGSGAFPVPRVRTVARGERASQSIVNRTTALWSIWVMASLILADSGHVPFTSSKRGRGFVISQRMGTLLRTLPRPLRVGRDQHPLRRGPRDPA